MKNDDKIEKIFERYNEILPPFNTSTERDKELIKNILSHSPQSQLVEEKPIKINSKKYLYMSIAASIVIMIGTVFLFEKYNTINVTKEIAKNEPIVDPKLRENQSIQEVALLEYNKEISFKESTRGNSKDSFDEICEIELKEILEKENLPFAYENSTFKIDRVLVDGKECKLQIYIDKAKNKIAFKYIYKDKNLNNQLFDKFINKIQEKIKYHIKLNE